MCSPLVSLWGGGGGESRKGGRVGRGRVEGESGKGEGWRGGGEGEEGGGKGRMKK